MLGVLGLVVGFVGILISIVIGVKQRRPKRVTHELTANRRIITRTAYQATGDLVVMYQDRPLKDPHLMVMRVANAGKVEVRPEDWQEPFAIETEGELIDSDIVGTSNKDVEVAIAQREQHRVSCSKMLLNPGEWFDVQMLVDGPSEVPDVSARIAGAKLEAARRTRPGLTLGGRTMTRREKWRALLLLLAVGVCIGVIAYANNVSAMLHTVSGSDTTSVPRLIGRPVVQVVPDLHSANLHLGGEEFVPSHEATGTVVDQHPGAGSLVGPGTEVSIVIAR